jgi:hypothetical protein
MVTVVPPVVVPEVGVSDVTMGAGVMKVKAAVLVTVPCVVSTETFTLPAPWAGVVAVMEVVLTTLKLAAVVAPNLTFVVPVRWDPVMVTVVPPVVEPEAGVSEVTLGGGATVVLACGDVGIVPVKPTREVAWAAKP